jgi:hypothetical protein
MASHMWYECRPALVALPGATSDEITEMIAKIERVWATLTEEDKIAWHRAHCWDRPDHPATMAVVQRILDQLQ